MSLMGIVHEEFSCYRDGLKIRGSMFRPKGNGPFPTIVVSHEFMMNRLTTLSYAVMFARMGYAAFCYDFNGGGTISQSEGRTTDMSVLTEVEDLKAVIDYVGKLPYTDMDDFNLMGCSQGGFVSALVAAEYGADFVKKLVLFYPALSIPDDARKGHMIKAVFDPKNVPETLRCGPMKLGRRYVTDVIDMDVWREISGYTGQVLLVHGSSDTLVDPSYSKRAFEVYRACGAEATLKMISGAGHIFIKPAHMKEAKEILTQAQQTF